MNQITQRLVFYGLPAVAMGTAWAGNKPPYDGLRRCKSCHDAQYESWLEPDHRQIMTVLEAGEKAQVKKKVGLDPAKDYTEDPDCIGCHVTGYGEEGGYEIDNPERLSQYLRGVGCESCHGPGSEYERGRRSAAERVDKLQEPTLREELAENGQVLSDKEFEERCNACHLNYGGSPWPYAKEPYTPFTPKVDPKYAFKFKEAVRNDEAMHKHFKLKGIFLGKLVASFHNEFQKHATPPKNKKE